MAAVNTPTRPRSRWLPLALTAVVVPALLLASSARQSTSGSDLGADAVCRNAPPAKVVVPRSPPSCVNCRAPLIDAPLAHAGQASPLPRLVALPPAA